MPAHSIARVKVDSASTTRRQNGDVELLVHTAAGPGVLVFSASLARQLFVVTNPTGLTAGGHPSTKEPRPLLTKPSGSLL